MSLFDESDVDSFRIDNLSVVQQKYFPNRTFSDEFIMRKLKAAEQEVGLLLKVKLEPTQVFSHIPTDDEVAALSGMPWIDEPGYDYDPEFFRNERWGYIITRQKPIIAIQSVSLVYPAPTNTVYAIPNDWLRPDRKYGHIRMVPASSQFVAPLGAFLMQALSGGNTIPGMIQVKYTCGLQDAKNEWPVIIDVILRRAVQRIIRDVFVESSASISTDGNSQSMAVKLQDYEDQFQTELFGPKGSNAGLYTAIHGINMGVAGVTA